MTILENLLKEYHSLNDTNLFDEYDITEEEFENKLTEMVLNHVPGSEVFVVSTSWSEDCGITSSEIIQTCNLKSIGDTTYSPGEEYEIHTHMFTKIDKQKEAGILVYGQNTETPCYFTLFKG